MPKGLSPLEACVCMYPCVGRLVSVLATDLIKRDNVDTSSLSLKLQLLAFFADVS